MVLGTDQQNSRLKDRQTDIATYWAKNYVNLDFFELDVQDQQNDIQIDQTALLPIELLAQLKIDFILIYYYFTIETVLIRTIGT